MLRLLRLIAGIGESCEIGRRIECASVTGTSALAATEEAASDTHSSGELALWDKGVPSRSPVLREEHEARSGVPGLKRRLAAILSDRTQPQIQRL